MATSKRNTTNDALLVETATTLKIMNERLFGGVGQADGGALHFIMGQHEKLAARMEVNKQELLDRVDTKKAETDLAVKTVADAQSMLDRKVTRFTTVAATVNTLFLGAMAALGFYHKVHIGQ